MPSTRTATLTLLFTFVGCGEATQPSAVLSGTAAPEQAGVGQSVRNALDRDPSVERYGFVHIDLDALRRPDPDLRFAVPGEHTRLQASLLEHYVQYGDDEDAVVWSGTITTVDDAEAPHGAAAIFVVTANRVAGQLTFDGQTLDIVTIEEGGHYLLVERDFAKLPHDDDRPLHHAPPIDLPPRDQDASRNTSALTTDTVVRVLQIASPEAQQVLGGPQATKDRLRFFLAQANQAFTNSGVGVRVVNAGLRLASRSPGTNNSTRLLTRLKRTNDGMVYDNFAGGTANGNGREGTRADIVALTVDYLQIPNGDGTFAYPRGHAFAVGAKPNEAFFVIRANATELTWAHEVGHLFGADHQYDLPESPYTFGHAFVYRGAPSFFAPTTDAFHTVMGVGPASATRIPFFSSDTRRRRGHVIGDAATRDNERVLRRRKAAVSNFR